jgi:hypothetical protein
MQAMNKNFYAYAENPDNSAAVHSDIEGDSDKVLAWARNMINEGYVVYVFHGEQRVEVVS